MVLKDAKVVPSMGTQGEEKRRKISPHIISLALVVCGVVLVAFAIHQYHGSPFGNTPATIAITLALLIGALVLPFLGLLGTLKWLPEGNDVGLSLAVVMIPALCGMFIMGFLTAKDSKADEAFENSIAQEYKQQHHLDKVKVQREGSASDKSGKVLVYRFTHPDGKSEVIAYHGRKGTNEVTSQEDFAHMKLDNFKESDPQNAGTWR